MRRLYFSLLSTRKKRLYEWQKMTKNGFLSLAFIWDFSIFFVKFATLRRTASLSSTPYEKVFSFAKLFAHLKDFRRYLEILNFQRNLTKFFLFIVVLEIKKLLFQKVPKKNYVRRKFKEFFHRNYSLHWATGRFFGQFLSRSPFFAF